ncbi:MAG: hypothetical protein KUG78_09015 [Kangiellaceae bacterium]|nr:hypothetical protein [Kangiellaceae bacterium]
MKMWGLNKKSDSKCVLISLTNSEARLFHVEIISNKIKVLESHSDEYSTQKQLEDICSSWIQTVKAKGLPCHWLLSRSQYRTFAVAPPKVPESELSEAIKWLVKDQLEQPLDTVLVSYYKPYKVERETEKLVAVVVQRDVVESLIEITETLNLNLSSIQISELAASNALASINGEEQITGLIDEDNIGLTYNFYVGHSLAFTRHIKGRFFPGQDGNTFSLDSEDNEAQMDQFLLETQRTLDYCVSQFFRKPVDRLLLDSQKTKIEGLLESLEQISEIPVELVTLEQARESIEDSTRQQSLSLTTAESGATLTNNQSQQVNFYLAQYQPKPLEFSFQYAAALVAVSVVGFALLGFVKEKELSALQSKLVEQNELLSKTQTSLQSLSKKIGRSSSIKELDRQLVKKQNELKASRQLLSNVENTSPSEAVIYSEILAALSGHHAESLWLTKIQLGPKTIDLSGQTTKPESIPLYIDGMSNHVVLASQFDNLIIERDKQNTQLVHFQMTNGRYKNAK